MEAEWGGGRLGAAMLSYQRAPPVPRGILKLGWPCSHPELGELAGLLYPPQGIIGCRLPWEEALTLAEATFQPQAVWGSTP